MAASTLYLGQVVSVISMISLQYIHNIYTTISIISIMNIILDQADGTLQKHDVLEPTHSEYKEPILKVFKYLHITENI